MITGKAFLYSLLEFDKDVKHKLEMLAELKSLAIGTTASTDKEPVQSSGSQDKLGGIVAKIVDLETDINIATDELCDRRKLAKEIIFQISNEKYQNVLYDLFILCNPLYMVAENHDMTYDACKGYRNRAIVIFDELFEPYKTTYC